MSITSAKDAAIYSTRFCSALLGFSAALLMLATATAGADTKSQLHILSIGSDVTEILYELGLGDRIVAVDTTSQHPPEALATKQSVGYMRALSPEGVLSVGANLILASEGSGPVEAIRALKASAARYVEVPAGKTAEGVGQKIDAIARAVGAEQAGADLKARVARDFKVLKDGLPNVGERKRVLFVLTANGQRMIVGGSGTSADEILKLAHADNAAGAVSGFKPIPPESLVSMAPDAIIVMQGGRGGMDAAELRENSVVKLTPAGRSGTLRDMSGVLLLGFGPRAPKAAAEVFAWLYPSSVQRSQ